MKCRTILDPLKETYSTLDRRFTITSRRYCDKNLKSSLKQKQNFILSKENYGPSNWYSELVLKVILQLSSGSHIMKYLSQLSVNSSVRSKRAV